MGEWRRLDCSGRLWDSCQNINKVQTPHTSLIVSINRNSEERSIDHHHHHSYAMMIFSKLPLLLAGAIASTASAAQFEGYVMDNQCVELCKETTSDSPCTPDTSNAFYSPQRHTGWCLQLQVCIDSGYSLMSLEPDESGRHSILMAFAGDESQQAVLDYGAFYIGLVSLFASLSLMSSAESSDTLHL